MEKVSEKIDKTNATLKEMLGWLRFQNIDRLRNMLTIELDTDEKKVSFENTDGEKTIDQIQALSGAHRDTIYSWWKKWYRLGIATESETRQGRMKKICSLEDLGIKVPKIKTSQKKHSDAEPHTRKGRNANSKIDTIIKDGGASVGKE